MSSVCKREYTTLLAVVVEMNAITAEDKFDVEGGGKEGEEGRREWREGSGETSAGRREREKGRKKGEWRGRAPVGLFFHPSAPFVPPILSPP
jgi:hypothetical protein